MTWPNWVHGTVAGLSAGIVLIGGHYVPNFSGYFFLFIIISLLLYIIVLVIVQKSRKWLDSYNVPEARAAVVSSNLRDDERDMRK